MTKDLSTKYHQHILLDRNPVGRIGAAARSVCPADTVRALVLSTTPDDGVPTIRFLGLEAAALESLGAAGITNVHTWYDLPLEAPTPALNAACDYVREHDINVIVHVGGQSGEDASEIIKLVVNGGVEPYDAWGYARSTLSGAAPTPIDDSRPERVVSVSYNTSILTGGPTSPFAVMFHPPTLEKVSAMHRSRCRPHCTLIGTDILARLPRRQLLLGGFDALAHCMSAYLSKPGGGPENFSMGPEIRTIEDYAFSGIRLLRDALVETALVPNHDGFCAIVEGALDGGRAISVGTGPEHLAAHSFGQIGYDGSGQAKVPHNAAVSALLIPMLDLVLHHCIAAQHVEGLQKLARIGQVFRDDALCTYAACTDALADAAGRGVATVSEFLAAGYLSCSLEPVTLNTLGIREEQLDLGLLLWGPMGNCHRNSPPYTYTQDDIRAMLRRAWDGGAGH